MSDLLIPSFLVSDVSELLRLLTKNDQPWATMSDSITKKERMRESLVILSKSLIRSFFHKKRGFAQKPDERISSPEKSSCVDIKIRYTNVLLRLKQVRSNIFENMKNLAKTFVYLCQR